MIILKTVEDCSKIPNGKLQQTVINILRAVFCPYEENHLRYNPEEDGYWQLLEEVDDIRHLPFAYVWEGMKVHDDLFELLVLRNNQFVMSYLIPKDIANQSPWLLSKLNEFLELVS